jgi:hypothetical protein
MVLSTTAEQVTEFILVCLVSAGGAHQTASQFLAIIFAERLLPHFSHGRFVQYDMLFCNARQRVYVC